MSSESSLSPIKSSSSSRHHSSNTTSVPEISTLSSISSHGRQEISQLKKRVELLHTQLRQRECALSAEQCERRGAVVEQKRQRDETEQLKHKSAALTVICDELMVWMRNCEQEDAHRVKEIETIYRRHNDETARSLQALREENGKLRQRITANDTKISAVIHENAYLRWENESRGQQLEDTKKRLDKEVHGNKEMRAEIQQLRSSMREASDAKAAKRVIEKALHSTVATTSTELERVRRVHADREKEYGITLSRMQNELDFLVIENARLSTQSTRLTSMLDELTLDNRKLFETQADMKRQMEGAEEASANEIASLSTRCSLLTQSCSTLQAALTQIEQGLLEIDRLDQSGQRPADCGRLRLLIDAKDKQLADAADQVNSMNRQISTLLTLPADSDSAAADLRRKTLQLIEAEEWLRISQRECSAISKERDDGSFLLVEIGKDMNRLLAILEKTTK